MSIGDAICPHGIQAEDDCDECADDASLAYWHRRLEEDGPPDADHELGDTAREQDERAWAEKRSLR